MRYTEWQVQQDFLGDHVWNPVAWLPTFKEARAEYVRRRSEEPKTLTRVVRVVVTE